MNETIQSITLNLRDSGGRPIINARRGDTARMLEIHLFDGTKPYLLSECCYAVFSAKKENGEVLFNNCVIRDNAIFYTFTEQTTSEVGQLQVEIKVYGGNKQMITSARFYLQIFDTVFTDGNVSSGHHEMEGLNTLINQTLDLQNTLKDKLQRGDLNGDSAYKIAVKNGYQGTEKEWLMSLQYDHSEEFQVLSENVKKMEMQTASFSEAAEESQRAAAEWAEAAQQGNISAQTSAKKAETAELNSLRSANTAEQHRNVARTSADSAQSSADLSEASALRAQNSAEAAQIASNTAQNMINDTLISEKSAVSSEKLYRIFENIFPDFHQTANAVCGCLVKDYPLSVVQDLPLKYKAEIAGGEILPWQSLSCTVCGKNMLPRPYYDEDKKEENGVKYDVLPDGRIHAYGTAVERSIFYLFRQNLLCGGNVDLVVSGPLSEVDRDTCYIQGKFKSSSGQDAYLNVHAEGYCFTGNIENLYISIAKGTTIDTVFSPQIEIGKQVTAYEPYCGEIITENLVEAIGAGKWNVASGEVTVTHDLNGNILKVPKILRVSPHYINAESESTIVYGNAGEITVEGKENPKIILKKVENRLESTKEPMAEGKVI